MTFAEYVENSGITTYEKLCIVCERQFVIPPDKSAFDSIVGKPKSNPTEGIAVIGDDDEDSLPKDAPDPEDVSFPTQSKQKKQRKKLDIPDTEPAPADQATHDKLEL